MGVNVSIADEERVDIANFQTTDTGSLQFTTRGPASTGMWVDWGDGTAPEWIQHIGTGSNVVTSHNYGGLVGTKKISFYGILSAVTRFVCTDVSLSGNVSALSTFINMVFTSLNSTAVSGDFGSLSGLESLEYFLATFTGIGYESTTLPSWSSTEIYLQNNSWTQAEVDNFLADLDSAGGTNGILNVGGNNSAPSAAGLTSKANLEGKGWTVTVTP